MDVLMNGLLLAATLFAGGYCWILSRRVHDLKSLDGGLGGAIVTLTRQIELARGTLEEARTATREKARDLNQLIARAEAATATLKATLAAARDIEVRITPRGVSPEVTEKPNESPQGGRPDLRLAASADTGVADFVAASGRAPILDDFVPKPRGLSPLRSPAMARPAPVPEGEDELINVLTALASGQR